MLVDKTTLVQYLDGVCDRIVVDNDKCKSIYNYANETYDMPKSMMSDLITRRKSLFEVSEFVLFILFDSAKEALNDGRKIKNINEFYTEKEIQFYKKNKYETDTIKFPLVFKMIQIDEDQWTGKIDVHTLMQLRKAQLINYNENAQRTMQRTVKGGKEIYKITLNRKAVESIVSNFKDRSFIPNTITLNIPTETESDFYYDDESCSLIIRSLEHFDITDGYHRYIAACNISDLDQDFNYNMELRIVNFTDDKAKQFIFQEDQKTKMSKIESNSLNMNKAANIVVTRLNESVRCNLKGLINRNDGIVSFADLAELVDYFYFKKSYIKKDQERSVIIHVVKELTENFNMITEYDTKYLENRMSYATLLSIMFCFDYYKANDLDLADICEVIEKTSHLIEQSDNKKFTIKTPRKSLMNEVEKIMKGVL